MRVCPARAALQSELLQHRQPAAGCGGMGRGRTNAARCSFTMSPDKLFAGTDIVSAMSRANAQWLLAVSVLSRSRLSKCLEEVLWEFSRSPLRTHLLALDVCGMSRD